MAYTDKDSMVNPPIDKLIKKTACRYALVSGLAKRAKELSAVHSDELERAHQKSISYAANEIYSGKIVIKIEE
ncbi:MAG: DNA-directed RNA polymerase subunit omega [Clostridia bacterium]